MKNPTSFSEVGFFILLHILLSGFTFRTSVRVNDDPHSGIRIPHISPRE